MKFKSQAQLIERPYSGLEIAYEKALRRVESAPINRAGWTLCRFQASYSGLQASLEASEILRTSFREKTKSYRGSSVPLA